MLNLPIIMLNLVLTKFSGPKHHAVAFTVLIFASFCVCHTDDGEVQRACVGKN